MKKIFLAIIGLFLGSTAFAQTHKPDTSINQLKDYLKQNIRYAAIARENNISGEVTVKFNISTSGHIDSIKIVKSLFAQCDTEVVKRLRQFKGRLLVKPRAYSISVFFDAYSRDGKVLPVNLPAPPVIITVVKLFDLHIIGFSSFVSNIIAFNNADGELPGLNNINGRVKSVELDYNFPDFASDAIDIPLDRKVILKYNKNQKLKAKEENTYSWKGVITQRFRYDDNGTLLSNVSGLDKLKDDKQLKTYTKLNSDDRFVETPVFKDGQMSHILYRRYNKDSLCIEHGMLSSNRELIFKDLYSYDNDHRLKEKIFGQTARNQGDVFTYTYEDMDRLQNWRKLTIARNYISIQIDRKITYFH